MLTSVVPAAARHCLSPSPLAVPAVPSVIICVISLSGHGFWTEPPSLHVPEPLWSCMRPGFRTPKFVTGARTQPLLSCMTMAKMKRASTPVVEATDWMLDFRVAISSSLLLGTLNCVQDVLRTSLLLVNLGEEGC